MVRYEPHRLMMRFTVFTASYGICIFEKDKLWGARPGTWQTDGFMHELAVTEGLLQIILDQVQGSNVTRVYGVSLVIGDLASIVDESVQFYFDILSKGTVAEGAQLCVTRVVPEYGCRSCGFQSAERSQSYRCRACGAEDVFIGKGQEFYLDSIEVETADV